MYRGGEIEVRTHERAGSRAARPARFLSRVRWGGVKFSRPREMTTPKPDQHSSTLAPRTRSVLNFTLMHRIGRSIRQGPDSDDETAHEARICMLGCPETRKWCINALSAAELGQWVPRGAYTQAQATACDLELARWRALSASARAHRCHSSLSSSALVCTRPESRQTKATGGSSVP